VDVVVIQAFLLLVSRSDNDYKEEDVTNPIMQVVDSV
jgi:hypothetical protein